MAVIPGKLGQHKQAGDRSADGFHIEYRDTIESRHDVRFSKGTPFWSLQSVQIFTGILIFWNVACYGTILLAWYANKRGNDQHDRIYAPEKSARLNDLIC